VRTVHVYARHGVWVRYAGLVGLRQRRVMLESQLMATDGRLERVDGVQRLIAERLGN
jgi:hypothetical protein